MEGKPALTGISVSNIIKIKIKPLDENFNYESFQKNRQTMQKTNFWLAIKKI